ncbi:NADP-specific glutamate dehydrogenase, partial [Dysosmobacter welbionis]
HRRGVLVVLDLPDLPLHRILSGTAVLRIKGLGPDGEKGCIECQGLMDLEPGDAEGHHHVGHRVGLGEQVADLGQGVDVPLRHVVVPHGLHPALVKAALLHLALADLLHDLEAHLGVQALGDQVQHDIVPAAHRLQNGGGAADDQLPGVAQPHVCPVGEAGEPYQRVEVLGLGIHQHLPGESGVELRDRHGAGGAQNLVVLVSQHFAGGEDGHGVRVIQGNLAGVDTGQILHHADHGGVIVSQHVQLQEVCLHRVVFKMSGDGVGVVGVRRVLDRAEVLHVHIVGNDHQAAGVLTGGPAGAHAAQGQAILLCPAHSHAVLLQVFFHEAVSGLLRQCTDGTGPEHLGLSEHLDGVAVGPGLILTGEVQVDIRHLAAAEAQEGFKGDVEAVFDVFCAAHRADLVRHVRAAAVGAVLNELRMLAIRAAVVGRKAVHLCDPGHIGHQGRAYGASG